MWQNLPTPVVWKWSVCWKRVNLIMGAEEEARIGAAGQTFKAGIILYIKGRNSDKKNLCTGETGVFLLSGEKMESG